MSNNEAILAKQEETSITAGVDTERLFTAMRDAFTNKSKVVMELMQNARRAGSPRVEIHYDDAARILTVIDEGAGIKSFSALLQMAKSGWDAQTQAKESAFGIGAFSAVYGCGKLQVESKGRGFMADTRDILSFKEIPVYACAEQKTVIRMIGVHKLIDETVFREAARGFPIPVIYNGRELVREFALDHTYVQTSVGHVRLAAGCCMGAELYLQGFKIGSINLNYRSSPAGASIVHLDSTMFRARAPDRDCLVDADEANKVVERVLKGLFRQRYEALKANGDSDKLIEDARFLCSVGCVDLLNDIPVLPHAFIEPVEIEQFCDNDFSMTSCSRHNLTREQAGSMVLIEKRVFEDSYSTLEVMRYGEDGEREESMRSFNAIQYLALKGAHAVRDGLDRRHWVYSLNNLIRREMEPVQVELIQPLDMVAVSGRCIDHTFVPCGSLRFNGQLGPIESDSALGVVSMGDDKPMCIAVAKDADIDTLCKMLSDFKEDDFYNSDWFDEDSTLLQNELSVARSGNADFLLAEAIRKILATTAARKLSGRTFCVSLDLQAPYDERIRVKEVRAKPKLKARRRGKKKVA